MENKDELWEECKYWADYIHVSIEYLRGDYFLHIEGRQGPYTLEQISKHLNPNNKPRVS